MTPTIGITYTYDSTATTYDVYLSVPNPTGPVYVEHGAEKMYLPYDHNSQCVGGFFILAESDTLVIRCGDYTISGEYHKAAVTAVEGSLTADLSNFYCSIADAS